MTKRLSYCAATTIPFSGGVVPPLGRLTDESESVLRFSDDDTLDIDLGNIQNQGAIAHMITAKRRNPAHHAPSHLKHNIKR